MDEPTLTFTWYEIEFDWPMLAGMVVVALLVASIIVYLRRKRRP